MLVFQISRPGCVRCTPGILLSPEKNGQLIPQPTLAGPVQQARTEQSHQADLDLGPHGGFQSAHSEVAAGRKPQLRAFDAALDVAIT